MSDNRDLTTGGPGTALAPPQEQSSNFLSAIIAAAKDPSIDATKVDTLARLAMDLRREERQEEFNRDKVAALIEMPVINKNGAIIIPGKGHEPDRLQSRFARFEDIMAVTKPILARHNLALNFKAGHDENLRVMIIPVLSHRNGITEEGLDMAFPLDSSGAKNSTQGVGSAASYGKRQAAKAMLNIVEVFEDDDGTAAGGGTNAVPRDEQDAFLAEAEAEAAKGLDNWNGWFQALPAAKRGWLVSEGHSRRLKPVPGGQQQQRRDDSPPPQQDRTKRTPDEMVADYEAKLGTFTTLEALREFQSEEGTQRFTTSMKNKHPDLHRRITDANANAYERLGGA